MTERSWDPFEEILEDDLPEEVDQELLDRHGIGMGQEAFQPTLSDSAMLEIEQGRTTYEEIKAMQYSRKTSEYGEEKRRLQSKVRFKRDLEEAFGDIGNLGNTMAEYDSVLENLQTPECIDDTAKANKAMDKLPPQVVRQGMDNLIQDGQIDAEQWAGLVDNYMFAKNPLHDTHFGLSPEDMQPFIQGLLDDEVIDLDGYEFLMDKFCE